MPIKAIAVDIDGTVTDYEKVLDLTGVRALRAAEAKGIPVIVASGNVAPVTKAFSAFVGLSGPLVSEGGGVIHSNDMLRSKVLFSRKRPDQAVRYLRRKGFDAQTMWSDRWRVSEVALKLNLDEERVRSALEGWRLGVVGTRFALHIFEPGLDKLTGIKEALPLMRPRPRLSQVLAIGDSNNDVAMLEGCGYSGCVGNGSDRAKAAAVYVARRGFGRGVAEVLRHYRVV